VSAVKDILEKIRAEIASNLDGKGITATGRTRDGLQVREYVNGCKLVSWKGAPIATTEIGAKPHWSPIAPLKEWVKVKLHLPESVAYAVQYKIAQEGTDRFTAPRFDVYTEVVNDHMDEIAEAVTNDVNKELVEIVKHLNSKK